VTEPPVTGAGGRRAHMSIETSEPTMFGSGFASGIVSAVLGLAALGAVLCFRIPNVLTYADLRAY
jgi:hypothetical protein